MRRLERAPTRNISLVDLPLRDTNPPADAYNEPVDVDRMLGRVLLYGVLPCWVIPGFCDYLLHRSSRIERTSGTYESMIHVMQMSSAGIPTLMGLLLDVNAPVIGVMTVMTLVHEALTLWDVSYAEPLRRPSPTEQHMHSFLEVTPVMALAMVTALHPRPAAEFFRAPLGSLRQRMRRKRPPLSRRYVASLLGLIVVAVGVPYAEEFVRCYRTDRTLSPHWPPPRTDQPSSGVPREIDRSA